MDLDTGTAISAAVHGLSRYPGSAAHNIYFRTIIRSAAIIMRSLSVSITMHLP